MRAGPVREYTPPSYGTREQALADSKLRGLALPRKLFRHPLGAVLGITVAAGLACAYGCKAMCPTVYLSEAEALDILEDEFAEWSVEVSRDVGEGPWDVPVAPVLVNRELDIVVSLVVDEHCDAYKKAAAALYASADDLCGLGEPEDTGGPGADTGSDTGQVVDTERLGGAERGEDRALCRGLIEDDACYNQDVAFRYEACLDFACSDLHWLGIAVDDFEVCEGEQDYWGRWEVQDFVMDLRAEGVVPWPDSDG
jgi:hypothetical protein